MARPPKPAVKVSKLKLPVGPIAPAPGAMLKKPKGAKPK